MNVYAYVHRVCVCVCMHKVCECVHVCGCVLVCVYGWFKMCIFVLYWSWCGHF